MDCLVEAVEAVKHLVIVAAIQATMVAALLWLQVLR